MTSTEQQGLNFKIIYFLWFLWFIIYSTVNIVLCFVWLIEIILFQKIEENISKDSSIFTSKWTSIILLPTNIMSKLWSCIHSLTIPRLIRAPLYLLWSNWTKCNLEEMNQPLEEYPSLADFFSRGLKEGARKISNSDLVSPVDGLIVSCGKVEDNKIDQVKGINYCISKFLGIKERIENLHYINIYLSPGDYHRFHNPTDFSIHKSRHIPGILYSVHGIVSQYIKDLFILNERVVFEGKWKFGKFFFCAVGALNVGSIKTTIENYKTNSFTSWFDGSIIEKEYKNEINVKKGQELGHFTLGSSIVLIFESSNDFKFNVKKDQKISLGMEL